jgi:hypothetical protein
MARSLQTESRRRPPTPASNKHKEAMKHSKSSFVTLGLVSALTLTGCLGAEASPASNPEEIRVAVPVVPNLTLGDRSLYGAWGARWWQWVFSIPVSRTPLIDATGARCAEGQSGAVWFLAGYFIGDPALTSVTRACAIPAGKTLFFPIVNAEYDPWGVEPAPTDDELRDDIRGVIDGTTARYATLDGVAIPRLDRGRGAAGPFTFEIPAGGDDLLTYWGYPGAPRTLDRAYSDGYWLMLPPLTPGRHVLRFGGRFADGSPMDVTYHLTVAPRGR